MELMSTELNHGGTVDNNLVVKSCTFFFYSRTVVDKQTGQNVRLSDKDVDVVKRLMSNRVPDADYNMYEPFIDHFSYKVMDMPLSGRQEHKNAFHPSKVCVDQVFSVRHRCMRSIWQK